MIGSPFSYPCSSSSISLTFVSSTYSASSSAFVRRRVKKICELTPDKTYAIGRVSPKSHLRVVPKRTTANNGAGCFERHHSSVAHVGKDVFYRVWPVPPIYGRPRGTLFIIPGLIWHSGWFGPLAQLLTAQGLKVVAIDPLSSGRSDDIEGMRALVYDFERDHVQDIKLIIQNNAISNEPVFVMGESSGCITACLLALSPPINLPIAGWIMCGAALQIQPQLLPPAPLLFVISRFIAPMFPKYAAPNDVSGSTFDEAFGDDGVSAMLAKNDPNTMYDTPIPLATLRATLSSLNVIERALKKKTMSVNHLLAVHNKLDVRTRHQGSQRLVEMANVKGHARFVDPGGKAHQLFQEEHDVTMRVVDEIIGFVDQVCSSS